jgi:hypothetical protein
MTEVFAFAAPAAAAAYDLSSGRLGAMVAAVLGLVGVVLGGLALARPAGRFGTGKGRLGAGVALAAGLTGIVLGGLLVATADGGVGTGNGLAGAVVAMVVGLIATALGGLAMARSRRTLTSRSSRPGGAPGFSGRDRGR